MINEEGNKTDLKRKNNNPVKKVTHQDIFVLYELMEQLASWNEPLSLLQHFFDDDQYPVNKRKIVREYYACSKIFSAFHIEFGKSMERMEVEIRVLRGKEKI